VGGVQNPESSSIDAREVANFEALADAWWDPQGEFRPLHRINPIRLAFIRDHLGAHFGCDPLQPKPLKDLSILDIGCGGGLLCEPLARLGADVTGIDVVERNIKIARQHKEQMNLTINYRLSTAEAMVEEGRRFDAVLNLEVVEHVANPDTFLGNCATLTKDNGAMVVATLNRTIKAYLIAIVGAEYVMRWLPRGTHTWQKFLRPSEVANFLRPHGFVIQDLSGMIYNPIQDTWLLSRSLEVNYLAFAIKADQQPFL